MHAWPQLIYIKKNKIKLGTFDSCFKSFIIKTFDKMSQSNMNLDSLGAS